AVIRMADSTPAKRMLKPRIAKTAAPKFTLERAPRNASSAELPTGNARPFEIPNPHVLRLSPAVSSVDRRAFPDRTAQPAHHLFSCETFAKPAFRARFL